MLQYFIFRRMREECTRAGESEFREIEKRAPECASQGSENLFFGNHGPVDGV